MSALVAALSFGGRDFRIARSYRAAFIMSIASMFMSLVTFRFIARLVGDAPALQGAGDYFGFVVVGMAMAQVLEGAVSAPASAVRSEQMQGTLEALATTPMSAAALAAGWVSYPVIQGVFTGMVMLSLAGPMGLRLSADPVWTVAAVALVLSALAFAGLGILGAAVVLAIQQSAGVTRWVTGGLALVSGVFFPLELFPGWARALSQASPLTHSLRALRGSLLAGQGWQAMAGDLAALAACAAVLLPLSVGAVALGLRYARRKGSLATY